MWLPRGSNKPTLRIHNTSASPFSFKDIQNLCSEEPKETSSRGVFHRLCIASSSSAGFEQRPHAFAVRQPHLDSSISIPGADNRIVFYFTSLRAVRSTFEDCSAVRSILRGFRVSIDERDLAMDSRYLNELEGILGQRKQTLPLVFIGGRYIGGAEEVRQLHETGELKKFVNGLPAAEPRTCGVCGGHRFILCHDCNGSHKLYTQSPKMGFKTCTVCNENGLIRCPSCSCAPF